MTHQKIDQFSYSRIIKLIRISNTMCSINERFIVCVTHKNLDGEVQLLEAGANIHYNDDDALIRGISNSDWNMVLKLVEYGANIHVKTEPVMGTWML